MQRRAVMVPALFLSVLSVLILTAQAPVQEGALAPEAAVPASPLLGSWAVTSAQTSLILSVESGQEALVVWINPGSHSMERTHWRPMPGGILIESLPRLRLWAGRHDEELRAELESIPELEFDANEKFHDHFFMSRIKFMASRSQSRPLPAGWNADTVCEGWDETAGRQPLAPPLHRKVEGL